jgi:hypothetical protein
LYFHARYMKLDGGGSITVNRDFENLTMLPEMLTAYVGAVSNAGLPIRVLLEAMQKGGLLTDSADLGPARSGSRGEPAGDRGPESRRAADDVGREAEAADRQGRCP